MRNNKKQLNIKYNKQINETDIQEQKPHFWNLMKKFWTSKGLLFYTLDMGYPTLC